MDVAIRLRGAITDDSAELYRFLGGKYPLLSLAPYLGREAWVYVCDWEGSVHGVALIRAIESERCRIEYGEGPALLSLPGPARGRALYAVEATEWGEPGVHVRPDWFGPLGGCLAVVPGWWSDMFGSHLFPRGLSTDGIIKQVEDPRIVPAALRRLS